MSGARIGRYVRQLSRAVHFDESREIKIIRTGSGLWAEVPILPEGILDYSIDRRTFGRGSKTKGKLLCDKGVAAIRAILMREARKP